MVFQNFSYGYFQQTNTSLKSTTETLEKDGKYVQR